MAQYFIIVTNDMTELTGETRFPRIYSAIDNNAYPQSPAHIHEYNVFLAMHISLQVLSIGHGTSIVLDSHIIPQLFPKNLRQRPLFEIKNTITISRSRIYPPRYIDIYIQNFLAINRESFNKLLYDTG